MQIDEPNLAILDWRRSWICRQLNCAGVPMKDRSNIHRMVAELPEEDLDAVEQILSRLPTSKLLAKMRAATAVDYEKPGETFKLTPTLGNYLDSAILSIMMRLKVK
jgi:hypothetical protein